MMLDGVESDKNISYKEGIENIVTNYDVSIQKYLHNSLLKLYSNVNFLEEENDNNNVVNNDGYTFIIDPIDGTSNFARGIKLSAISVGLLPKIIMKQLLVRKILIKFKKF